MSPLSNVEEENGSPLRRPWEDDDDDDADVLLLRDEPRRRLIFQPWNGTGSENETPTSSSSLQPFVTISSETEGESPGRQSRQEEEEREERQGGEVVDAPVIGEDSWSLEASHSADFDETEALMRRDQFSSLYASRRPLVSPNEL